MSVAKLMNLIIDDQRRRIINLEYDRAILMDMLRIAIEEMATDYPKTTAHWRSQLKQLEDRDAQLAQAQGEIAGVGRSLPGYSRSPSCSQVPSQARAVAPVLAVKQAE